MLRRKEKCLIYYAKNRFFYGKLVYRPSKTEFCFQQKKLLACNMQKLVQLVPELFRTVISLVQ